MKQPMTPAQLQWLKIQRDNACQPVQGRRHSLVMDAHEIGSVEADLAQHLAQHLSQFLAQQGAVQTGHELHLQQQGDQWHVRGGGTGTQRLNHLAQLLRSLGLAGPWRNEQLAVFNTQGEQVATVERAAVRPLGIATRAVHLIGECADGAIWVQQRAATKATHPGMWDTLMGGMVSAGDSLEGALARETWEEAGLHVTALSEVQHGGHVCFSRPCDEAEGRGYMSERIDWFSARVPDALVPVNQDGEVQRFERLPCAELPHWLQQGKFTPEASLILAAYLGW